MKQLPSLMILTLIANSLGGSEFSPSKDVEYETRLQELQDEFKAANSTQKNAIATKIRNLKSWLYKFRDQEKQILKEIEQLEKNKTNQNQNRINELKLKLKQLSEGSPIR